MKFQYLVGILLLFIIITPFVSAGSIVHPALLFDTIQETPGFRYNTIEPWKSYQKEIIRGADNSLGYNFSASLGSHDRLLYRGGFAQQLGFAYQITKKPKYAIKAREALLNIDVGKVNVGIDKSSALGSYSLAYDFVQPTLDSANDTIIRDKLAILADDVYKDLNDNGKNRNYISFADYHGQAYPMMGIAGAALSDYSNPNNLPLSSTPADWHKVGTEYLFADDKLHNTGGRSLFSYGFDESSGKHLNGAYKTYVLSDFILWLQVYNHFYHENPFDKYPAAKRAFTSELWESLPNGYSNNYVTLGNTKLTYHRGIVNLLNKDERTNALNFDDMLEKSMILPYSRSSVEASSTILYCVYEDYTATQRSYPAATSHLDPDSIYQVFRGSWSNDADWLSLVTFNVDSRSNRDMMHGDQLSVEYYSRGDLLLADAGENKYVLDHKYGYYDIHHNTIAIENPRNSFPVSPWSGSASAGIYKGYSMEGIATPVMVDTIIQEPWMQLLQASAPVTQVMVGSLGNFETLSSPIQYERTILYPDSDYFVIVDRMEGTESWVYRNIFRPTSLMITPTFDANKDGSYSPSEVGHVNGALTIGSKTYDWQSLPYKTETNTGITASSLTWTSTNPYKKEVRLNLVSSPASEILIEKNIGRIGGYGAQSEVYNPVVYFRTTEVTSEYRVTALLSSYSTEAAKMATEIAVTGTGHAIKVSSASSDDYIYTGKGTSSFAGFTTDADTAYIRQRGNDVQVTLLGGSFLKHQNDPWVLLTKRADSITIDKSNGSTDYQIQGETNILGDIFQQPLDSSKIEKRVHSSEQQKPRVTNDTNTVSEESGKMKEFLVTLVKNILSFFSPYTKNG